MKWKFGPSNSIIVTLNTGVELVFLDLEEFDELTDNLVDARNEVAEALENLGEEEKPHGNKAEDL